MNRTYRSLAIPLLALTFVIYPFNVTAQTTPTVTIPDHCTVVDTDGVSHEYATGQYLGICALQAAKEQGAINAYTLQNFSFGLFVSSINGIVPDPASQFWSISHNGADAQVGLSDMVLAEGDVLGFQLTDFTNGSTIGSPISFTVTLEAAAPTPSAGNVGLTLHDPFDISAALNFLWEKQEADGSFGSLLLSDWVAIAVADGGAGDAKNALEAYFRMDPPALTSVLDNERHAMALLALGIDPYAGTGIDYITPIVEAFDGGQIGNTSLVNDDIFALFPLLHAGYGTDDDIIKHTVAFILARQRPNGSWEESVDMTAAAIQALSMVRAYPSVDAALRKAEAYLRETQNDNAGWGNTFSTSWALQAMRALGDSPYDWVRSVYHTPSYYLATFQQRDGGVASTASSTESRIWATAYAIPAIKGKTWDALLSTFPKPTPEAEVLPAATSTATSPAAPIETAETSEQPVFPPPEPQLMSETAPQDVPETIPSSEAETDEPRSQQVAAVAAVESGNDGLVYWIIGLAAVLFTSVWFLRFRNT